MKPVLSIGMIVLAWAATAQAQSIQISGTVRNAATTAPIPGAVVRLAVSGLGDTTDAQGAFALAGESVALVPRAGRTEGEGLPRLRVGPESPWILSFSGNGRARENPVSLVGRSRNRDGGGTFRGTFRLAAPGPAEGAPAAFKRAAGFLDTLVIEAAGFATRKLEITGKVQSALELTLTASETAPFALASPAWSAVDNADCTEADHAPCPLYPQKHTSYGENVSPAMSWTPGPSGTWSYALVLVDLSNGFAHWAMWKIPPSTTDLPAELPAGALADGSTQAGFNAGSAAKYFGSGACDHVYEHRLYALNAATVAPAAPVTAGTVRTAIEALRAGGGILAESFVRLESRDYCDGP